MRGYSSYDWEGGCTNPAETDVLSFGLKGSLAFIEPLFQVEDQTYPSRASSRFSTEKFTGDSFTLGRRLH